MEKVSFDIVLNLKNNISGALANVRKMFDGVDKSAKSVCSTTARFGSLCSKLKMPDVNALLGVTERLSSSFSELSQGGMSFGQSMADLSSITGILGDDLEALRENARKLGKDSGLGARYGRPCIFDSCQPDRCCHNRYVRFEQLAGKERDVGASLRNDH